MNVDALHIVTILSLNLKFGYEKLIIVGRSLWLFRYWLLYLFGVGIEVGQLAPPKEEVSSFPGTERIKKRINLSP